MKKIYLSCCFILATNFCVSQNTTLDTIAIDTNACLIKYKESITKENQNIFIRECLENATEKNIKALLKSYKVDDFKTINLKKYIADIIPYLSNRCKLKDKELKLAFAKWL